MGKHALPVQRIGRHRLDRPDRIHCTQFAAVADRLARKRSWRERLRPAGRHTWAWLSRTGGQPRPAFALILSL